MWGASVALWSFHLSPNLDFGKFFISLPLSAGT